MLDPQLILEHHRREIDDAMRAAERERGARLVRQATRIERWAGRSERIARRLAEMAKAKRRMA